MVESRLVVPVHAIVIRDDDGSRKARVDPAELRRWVEFANGPFAAVGIHFEFDPDRDVSAIASTSLNDLPAPPVPRWPRVKQLGDRLAARHPGKLVMLLRHGPGDRPAANGFAGTDHSFLVMPGTEDAWHCGHRHTDILAHEIGHYLGMDHTFVGEVFPDLAAAEAHFLAKGRDPAVFDGDGLPDTPPDPGIRDFEWQSVARISLAGVPFELPRRNLMSYYDERDSLSHEQATRARWMLEQRLAFPATMRPINAAGLGAVEAESLEPLHVRDTHTQAQSMTGYGVGDWSGEAHLFAAAELGGELSLRLVWTAPAGRPLLYATRAPDFGQLQVSIDGEACGPPIDLYAPS
jgi:hypothetical protein